MGEEQSAHKLGFLDSLARLFRREDGAPAPPRPEPDPASRVERLEEQFEDAVEALNQKIEQSRRESPIAGPTLPHAETPEEREAARKRRKETAHRAIREDIEKMHARLGTGLDGADLDALVAFLQEVAELAEQGRDSHALLPRARHAIAERLQHEAGELAVERLVVLLRRANVTWPDPTHYRPTATEEEIERSRRRRLAETRESFLASSLERTAERMLGIVRAWASNYPDHGSPLWEETVLEGVGAGIRADLVREFVELLRRDPDWLLTRTEELIGKELAALQDALHGGAGSIEQANRALVSSLRVVDEVVPDLAWEHVRAEVPRARGEWGDGAQPR